MYRHCWVAGLLCVDVRVREKGGGRGGIKIDIWLNRTSSTSVCRAAAMASTAKRASRAAWSPG
jgi:hypothetical protein